MTRHKSLIRQPRQQEVRTRRSTSLYHTPPQRPPTVTNRIVPHNLLTLEADRLIHEDFLQEEDRLPPISELTKAQLLADIEENGGLTVFSLKRLKLAKPDIYNLPKPALRQIQNCVSQWKKLDDVKYLLLLSHYNVRAGSRHPLYYAAVDSNLELSPQSPNKAIQPTPISHLPLPSSAPTTFASPSRYNWNQSAMSNNNLQSSNALTIHSCLQSTHHNEVEGMCNVL